MSFVFSYIRHSVTTNVIHKGNTSRMQIAREKYGKQIRLIKAWGWIPRCFWTFLELSKFSIIYYHNIEKSRTNLKYLFKILLLFISQNLGYPICWTFWKRRAPGNDKDPFNKFWQSLDMRSIFTRKHEIFLLVIWDQ